MAIRTKDLLDLEFLTAEEIREILDTAKPMKDVMMRDIKTVPALRGKTVATLFYENSTRTRLSFELAAKYLSAGTCNISASASSIQKGESLQDTGRTLEAMGTDIIVIRHNMSGAPKLLGEGVKARVINAGDGTHAHPTQALLDMFTIMERKGRIEGLTVTILGDILHSRVARSNIWGLTKMGAHVRLCGPPTLMPKEVEKMGAEVFYDIDEALNGADVVNVLRIQLERQQKGLFPSIEEYAKNYAMTEERLKRAKKDVLVQHPGPMNRSIEIPTAVADSAQCSVEEQVTNGVACRMALLYLMCGGENLV